MLEGLTQLGGCYSGVLCRNRNGFIHRMALATKKACDKLEKDPAVQLQLNGQLALYRRVDVRVLESAGFDTEVCLGPNGWMSFGIRLHGDSEDVGIYRAGEMLIISSDVGIHRRIFFGSRGISVPNEIDHLPPRTYSAMLARMAEQDRTLMRIATVTFDEESRVHVFDTEKMCLRFSRRLLEQDAGRFWAHLQGINHPIRP
jgi:hypothetical protein